MTRLRCALVVGVALAAVICVAPRGVRAEVRLVASTGLGQPHRVRVLATPAGPWTLVGPGSAAVLNPSGDAHADGTPVVLTSPSRVVVGWSRPGEGVFVAAADRRWTESLAIRDPLVAGAPTFVESTGGAVVAWSSGDGTTSVAGLTSALPIGIGEPIAIPSAWQIIAAAAVADGALLVTRDGVDLSIHWIVFSTTPLPTIPIPISLRESLSIHSAALGTTPDPTVPVEITKRIPDAPLPTLHEITHRQAEPTLVLTWWISPTELGWIELASTGPVSSERVLHGNANQAYSASLINEALRQAAGR